MDDPNIERSQHLLNDGCVDEALELLTSKLADVEQTGDRRLTGFYHWQIAVCHHVRQDVEPTIVHYETALYIFRTLDDSQRQIIGLLMNLATIYNQIGEHGLAISYSQEAKGLAEQGNEPFLVLSWLIESTLASARATEKHKAESLEQMQYAIERYRSDGNSLALSKEIEQLLQTAYQSENLVQSVACFNLVALAQSANDEPMYEEHRHLHSVLQRFTDETKFRQYIESDLGYENAKLFAAIWRVSRVAEYYRNISVQEFLESIAGIWLFSDNTRFINSFNLELESDFLQLASQSGDQTVAVAELETRYRNMLTYWRIRSFAERALMLIENDAGQTARNQIAFCRLLSKKQNNLQTFIELAEAQLDARLGQHRAAEKRLQRILNVLPAWDKCTALFEISQVFLALNEFTQAAQYATEYLSLRKELLWPDYNRLGNLGSIFTQTKQPDKVIECLEEWLAHVDNTTSNDRFSAFKLVLLAKAYQQTGCDQRLQVIIDRLLQYPSSTLEEQFHHVIIDLLGDMSWQFVATHREHLAIKYMTICLERSRQCHLQNAELSALDVIGLAHISLGQYIDAIPFYQQAVRLAHHMGEKQRVVDYMVNLIAAYQHILSTGTAYKNKTELEESIRCFEIVLPLMDELQEIEKKQQAQLNLAMMTIIASAAELEKRYAALLASERLTTLQFLDAEFVVLQTTHGGMSTIYFAFDKHPPFSATVIKALKPELARDWKLKEQFMHEAEIWLELRDHPNIVFLKAIREHINQIYLFLEFVIGPENGKAELSYWIGTPMLTPENCLRFGSHICDALDYAYMKFRERQVNFAHLDLKPANVLITRERVAKVVDFGISRLSYTLFSRLRTGESDEALESFTLSSPNEAVGTMPYMSPEQCRNESPLDIRSDIYSFGCLLFEMLTGNRLFKAFDFPMYVHLHTTVAPNLSKLDQLPLNEELKGIIGRCCEKDKANRYQNFAELGDALRALYANLANKMLAKEKTVEQDADQLVNAGLMRLQLDQIQDAIALFDQALQKDPQCVRALAHKAIALERLRRFTEALVCCDQALELNANRVQVLIIKGNIFSEQGDFQAAIEHFDRVLAIEKDNAGCWNNRGNALARSGNFNEALKSRVSGSTDEFVRRPI
jgi:serine/threonine protein kinase